MAATRGVTESEYLRIIEILVRVGKIPISMRTTLRVSDLPDDLIGTIACFWDTRTSCAFNSTCTQLRKLLGGVMLTQEASMRFMLEPEFRDRIRLGCFHLSEIFIFV